MTGERALAVAARHRRPLAAAAAALAALGALSAGHPRPAATVAVLVAATDLPPGAVLSAGELRTERLPAPEVPHGALLAVPRGRVLADPLPAGEPLTASALAGPAWLPGREVEAAVALSDPAESAALASGERVEVIAARADGSAAVLAPGARVAALPEPGLVVVVVSPAQALALAAAAPVARLSIAVESFG